jgi:hypothetical protein
MRQSKHALIGAGRWARWLSIASRVPDTFEAARSGLRTCFGDVRGPARAACDAFRCRVSISGRCACCAACANFACCDANLPAGARFGPVSAHRRAARSPSRQRAPDPRARTPSAGADGRPRRRRLVHLIPRRPCLRSPRALCRFLSCRHAACPPCLPTSTSCRHASAGAAGTRDAPGSRHDDQSRAHRCGPRRGAATAASELANLSPCLPRRSPYVPPPFRAARGDNCTGPDARSPERAARKIFAIPRRAARGRRGPPSSRARARAVRVPRWTALRGMTRRTRTHRVRRLWRQYTRVTGRRGDVPPHLSGRPGRCARDIPTARWAQSFGACWVPRCRARGGRLGPSCIAVTCAGA